MHISRREMIGRACAASVGTVLPLGQVAAGDEASEALFAKLGEVAAQPVLRLGNLSAPVEVRSVELLRHRDEFLIRIRSTEGDEGIAFANSMRMIECYPIFLRRVQPFLIGQDLRHWEDALWELYRYRSNYKFQGLALWVCVAAAELAVLDLLGKRLGKPIGDLLGGVRRRAIAVYQASGNRGNSPQEEVEYLQRLIGETGARAVKFRLGGRMSRNTDSLPGRSERLVPLAREVLGDDIALYADANSSYDTARAIRIGRLMEEYGYGFFEEPCPFDHWEETAGVARALRIPVAGGEQEYSRWRFRRAVAHRMVDIVQPDIHYYGGMVRAMRVARMADAAGLLCTPHMSGSGLGYLDAAHFVSCLPNPAAHHEFKGNTRLPVECNTSSLRCEKGIVTVPSGPGYGIEIDPQFLRKAQRVTL